MGKEDFYHRHTLAQLGEGQTFIYMGIGLQLPPNRPGILVAFSPTESVNDQRMELVTEEVMIALRDFFLQYEGLRILLEDKSVCIQLVSGYDIDRRVLRENLISWNQLKLRLDQVQNADSSSEKGPTS